MPDADDVVEVSRAIIKAIPGSMDVVTVQMALVRVYVLNAICLGWSQEKIMEIVAIGIDAFDHRVDQGVGPKPDAN